MSRSVVDSITRMEMNEVEYPPTDMPSQHHNPKNYVGVVRSPAIPEEISTG